MPEHQGEYYDHAALIAGGEEKEAGVSALDLEYLQWSIDQSNRFEGAAGGPAGGNSDLFDSAVLRQGLEGLEGLEEQRRCPGAPVKLRVEPVYERALNRRRLEYPNM